MDLRETCAGGSTGEERVSTGGERELPPVTWEERDERRLREERLLGDLRRGEREGAREREGALERRLNEVECDVREPSGEEGEDEEPSSSERRLRRPKPLHSSSRIRSLIRLA